MQTAIDPKKGPPGEMRHWPERLHALSGVWGVVVLFVLIIGGIYLGVFTPTEAAAVGAAGAFLFALLRGKLGLQGTFDALVESGTTTAMIFVVTFGALVFSNFINIAGLTNAMSDWIESLHASPTGVIIAMCAIYLVLGCIFDSLAMLILTVPVFTAILNPMGVDLIWFGIIVIIVVELGLITPPIGMNVFVVNASIPDINVWTVFRGVWPFLLAMLVCLALVIAFPALATLLPKLM